MYFVNGGDSMKVVILAGGFGTRISEESHLKPKPMIEIGVKSRIHQSYLPRLGIIIVNLHPVICQVKGHI